MDFTYLAPPEDAHRVAHTDYYIKHGEREKASRKIYEGVTYSQYEQEKIQELKQEIAKRNIILPRGFKESDYLKMGYSGRFKMVDVIKKLEANIQWRMNPLYHQLSDKIVAFLQTGIIYTIGRDKQFRPIVIFNAHLIDTKKYDKEYIIQSLSFFMGIVRNYMFIPNKVENWIFILETNGIGVSSLPVKALGVVIETLTLNFAACLEKMFILNPSTTLNFLWNVVKGWLDDETKQKINFITKKQINILQEQVDKNQLETQYGGTVPTQKIFWPPYNLDLRDGYTKPTPPMMQIEPEVVNKFEKNVNQIEQTEKIQQVEFVQQEEQPQKVEKIEQVYVENTVVHPMPVEKHYEPQEEPVPQNQQQQQKSLKMNRQDSEENENIKFTIDQFIMNHQQMYIGPKEPTVQDEEKQIHYEAQQSAAQQSAAQQSAQFRQPEEEQQQQIHIPQKPDSNRQSVVTITKISPEDPQEQIPEQKIPEVEFQDPSHGQKGCCSTTCIIF
ncbi:hypothetical protein pb186bvf_002307 [Paramecium bursaria]